MNRFPIFCVLLAVMHTADARSQSRPLVIDSIDCETSLAWPFLLQSDDDAAPEWAVLIEHDLVVSETRPGTDDRRIRLPDDTSLFDVRDLNRDGRLDLAAIRGEYLEYWPDAFQLDPMQPNGRIEDTRFAALAYGAPRPARLFLSQQGQTFLSAPIEGEPRLWTIEGSAIITPVVSSAPVSLVFSQAWEAAPGPASMRGANEYQIVQQFQSPRRDPATQSDAAVQGLGASLARDAAGAPTSEWPSFALRSGTADRVAFALLSPDFQETLIELRRPEVQATPRPPSPKPIPGILIVPGGRAPDVNGDGYADLVLWRSARPAPTLDALARAAHSGGWAIVVTVHPFEPSRDRFAARPITWFRIDAPLVSVLSTNISGPFAHVRFDDVDGDGREEMLTSGAGTEFVVWKFAGGRVAMPTFRTAFGESVLDVEFMARAPEFGWLAVVRTSRAFHAVTLPID